MASHSSHSDARSRSCSVGSRQSHDMLPDHHHRPQEATGRLAISTGQFNGNSGCQSSGDNDNVAVDPLAEGSGQDASPSRSHSDLQGPIILLEQDRAASDLGSDRCPTPDTDDRSSVPDSPSPMSPTSAMRILLPDNGSWICPASALSPESMEKIVELDQLELYGLVLAMGRRLCVLEILQASPKSWLDWIVSVDKMYYHNPYHNFRHAVDVAFIVFFTLVTLHSKEMLTELERVAVFLAALCHDMGHPGRNNLYLINTKDSLAAKYRNVSVLENYSIDLARELLDKHELVKAMHPADREYINTILQESILASDMSRHFALVKELGALSDYVLSQEKHVDQPGDIKAQGPASSLLVAPSRLFDPHSSDRTGAATPSSLLSLNISERAPTRSNQGALLFQGRSVDQLLAKDSYSVSGTGERSLPSSPKINGLSPFDAHCSGQLLPSAASSLLDVHTSVEALLSAEQRLTVIRCLLHAADISNTVRPWILCKNWSDLVLEEHFAQGDAERTAHLPLSPNMDRTSCHQALISLDFCDLIVQPFFVLFADVMPGAELYVDQLAANRAHWERIKAAEMTKGMHTPNITAQTISVSESHSPAKQSAIFSSPKSVASPLAISVLEGKELGAGSRPQASAKSLDSSIPVSSSTPSLNIPRRLSVAAGVISIPEQYFRASSLDRLSGASGSRQQSTSWTPPETSEANLDAPGKWKSESMSSQASEASSSQARSSNPVLNTSITSPKTRSSTSPGMFATLTSPLGARPAALGSGDFDSLYIAYLARARRRSSRSSGTSPLNDPSATRRYSIAASERLKRRKSVAASHAMALSSANSTGSPFGGSAVSLDASFAHSHLGLASSGTILEQTGALQTADESERGWAVPPFQGGSPDMDQYAGPIHGQLPSLLTTALNGSPLSKSRMSDSSQ